MTQDHLFLFALDEPEALLAEMRKAAERRARELDNPFSAPTLVKRWKAVAKALGDAELHLALLLDASPSAQSTRQSERVEHELDPPRVKEPEPEPPAAA